MMRIEMRRFGGWLRDSHMMGRLGTITRNRFYNICSLKHSPAHWCLIYESKAVEKGFTNKYTKRSINENTQICSQNISDHHVYLFSPSSLFIIILHHLVENDWFLPKYWFRFRVAWSDVYCVGTTTVGRVVESKVVAISTRRSVCCPTSWRPNWRCTSIWAYWRR